ncbi:MAG: PAS domain S-box protein [Lentisphaerae bacterium]|nr:PAS domain S-box protein [Lentisphaerota bacterium]
MKRPAVTAADTGRSAGETALLEEFTQAGFEGRVLDQIGDMVTVTDLKGRIVYVNRAVERVLGWSRQELLGKAVQVYGDDTEEGATQEDIVRVTRERGAWLGEVINVDRHGNRHVVEAHTFLMRNEAGMPVAMCGVARDVTERREMERRQLSMEAQLRQAQKLEAIGVLAGGVAHEINNPIAGVMNYAELIMDRVDGKHEIGDFAREIKRETQRVATIVSSLLEFAGRDRGVREPASLAEIVDGVLTLVSAIMRHDNIRIDVDLPADLPAVHCHAQQMQQVIMNLLTNARDALNEKFKNDADQKHIVIRAVAARRGHRVQVTVEDDGPGIPAQARERIFDPFYTTKPQGQGTGLGLAISRKIVQNQGGRMWLESEEGLYTRFCIEIPTAAQAAEEAESES